jgi:adenine-specific DNA-methyltransferase
MLKAFLSESERGITPHTWWDHAFAGHNKEATLEMKALFDGDSPFDTPKPVKLMRRLLDLFCANGDLVMDFFCGSAAFGHAAMQAVSQGDRTSLPFILVQLPEPIVREGFRSIADISKERLRRASKLLQSESPMFSGDLGFRVFQLAASNITAWAPKRDDLAKSLFDHIDHVVADRSEDDLLYELLLKLGLDLCVPIEAKSIAGKSVQSIGAGVLLACLDQQITVIDAEPLALGIVAWHREHQTAGEVTCVFRDSAFVDDVAKTNLAAILEQHGIAKVRSL